MVSSTDFQSVVSPSCHRNGRSGSSSLLDGRPAHPVVVAEITTEFTNSMSHDRFRPLIASGSSISSVSTTASCFSNPSSISTTSSCFSSQSDWDVSSLASSSYASIASEDLSETSANTLFGDCDGDGIPDAQSRSQTQADDDAKAEEQQKSKPGQLALAGVKALMSSIEDAQDEQDQTMQKIDDLQTAISQLKVRYRQRRISVHKVVDARQLLSPLAYRKRSTADTDTNSATATTNTTDRRQAYRSGRLHQQLGVAMDDEEEDGVYDESRETVSRLKRLHKEALESNHGDSPRLPRHKSAPVLIPLLPIDESTEGGGDGNEADDMSAHDDLELDTGSVSMTASPELPDEGRTSLKKWLSSLEQTWC